MGREARRGRCALGTLADLHARLVRVRVRVRGRVRVRIRVRIRVSPRLLEGALPLFKRAAHLQGVRVRIRARVRIRVRVGVRVGVRVRVRVRG